ncbi:MAG: triose-phosphate isomerase [Rickettsiales bacterium]|nr:triose-phosphate isomerase [Rickettsiales bacterium]
MSKNITPLVVGNWKMNGLQETAISLVDDLLSSLGQNPPLESNIVVCPPFTLTALIADKIRNSAITIGAQDCHYEDSGAFTGSISPQMLKEFTCKHVILGHSERRTLDGETNDQVKQKATAVHANDMTAIICVGESLKERESGKTLQVIDLQLQQSVPLSATPENTVIAYEPIWAIGTGRTASTEQIGEVHAAIKSLTHSRSPNFSGAFRVIYGGSVKPDNAHEIMSLKNVDGALVGGASLDANNFWDIAVAASHAVKNPAITPDKS